MDSRKYEAIMTVDECGSISAAAQKLGCTQSCLSRMIDRMEAEIGVTLLARSHGRTVLSEQGRLLRPAIAGVVQSEKMLTAKINAIRREKESHVRLLCCSDLAASCLPEIIASFLSLHPDLDLDLQQTDDPVLMHELLCSNRADFAFCSQPLPECRWESLGQSRLVLLLPPQMTDASACCDAFSGKSIILPSYGYTEELKSQLAAHIDSVRFVRSSLNNAAIMQMVEHDLAASVMPALCMRGRKTEICQMPLDPCLYCEYGVATCAECQPSEICMEFLAYASEQLSARIA